MEISPYIEQAINNPAAKVFFTAEDIFFDSRLTIQEKRLLLENIDLAENGLIHASRK